jgi:hypothetical protein
MADKDSNIYLDYLDKEMTIMGVLSTFCVLVAGGALDRVSSSANTYFEVVWKHGNAFIIVGSIFALFAALCFYLQRSLLAWYYGQISLCLTKTKPEITGKTRSEKTEYEYSLNDWYADADSWPTWIRYNCAFGFLILAFSEYGFALISFKIEHFLRHKVLYLSAPVLILLPLYVLWILLLLKYPYEDNPVKAFFTSKRTAAIPEITLADVARRGVEQHAQHLKTRFKNIVAVSDAVHDLSQAETHKIAIYVHDDNAKGIPKKLRVNMPDGSIRSIHTEIILKTGHGKIHLSQLNTSIADGENPTYKGSICCAVRSSSDPDFSGVLTSAHIYSSGTYDDSSNGLLNEAQQKTVALNETNSGTWYLQVMSNEQDLAVARLTPNQPLDQNYKSFNNQFYTVTNKDMKVTAVTILSKDGKTTPAFMLANNIGLPVAYDDGPSYKSGIILIGSTTDRTTSKTVSEPGDSGSCVFHSQNQQLIGMLLGGDDSFSYVLPIQETLQSFNLQVI